MIDRIAVGFKLLVLGVALLQFRGFAVAAGRLSTSGHLNCCASFDPIWSSFRCAGIGTPTYSVSCLAVSPDSKFVACCRNDGSVNVFQLNPFRIVRRFNLWKVPALEAKEYMYGPTSAYFDDAHGVLKLALTDGSLVALSTRNWKTLYCHISKYKELQFVCAQIFDKGQKVALVSDNGTVTVSGFAGVGPVDTWNTELSSVQGGYVDPTGRRLLLFSYGHKMGQRTGSLYDAARHKLITSAFPFGQFSNAQPFSLNGNRCVWRQMPGEYSLLRHYFPEVREPYSPLYVWSVGDTRFRPVYRVSIPGDFVFTSSLSPDGKLVVLCGSVSHGGYAMAIRLNKTGDVGRCTATLGAPGEHQDKSDIDDLGAPISETFLPDSRGVLFGYYDGDVDYWDLSEGRNFLIKLN